MKIIVAGSRTIQDYQIVSEILMEYADEFDELVSGTAKGVDSLGAAWARARDIPVVEFPANWDVYGKRAGFLRNIQMGEYGDKLIAIWDGKSYGTHHMIKIMKELNKPVEVILIE